MNDFDITMDNTLQFSGCSAPDQPTSDKSQERLRVTLANNLLTIAELRSDQSLGNRIYARRTLKIGDLTCFAILCELPAGAPAAGFFAADGTASLFSEKGTRRLRAAGTDTLNGGLCRGWIFDAVEVPAGATKPVESRAVKSDMTARA